MTGPPSFVLAGPDGAVVATGVHTGYPRLADAQAALRTRSTPIIVGALPFDTSGATALFRPQTVAFAPALPGPPPTPMPTVHVAEMIPAPPVHRARVAAAVTALGDPGTGLHKVVLARSLRLVSDHSMDAQTILHRLNIEDPSATAYFADLTTAGGRYRGAALVGASPELLVARRGEVLTCRPFAGSAPRSADPEVDRANAAALAGSEKNRHEHALVVDEMRKTLEPLCLDLQIASEPDLSRTAAVWHLSTTITGTLRETSLTALDLAVALHPTPAVGGVPARTAAALIGEIEGDRGFYAGAVGWCDADGDGRWQVSIRCAQLSADRRTATASAGGGIVAESDPDDEVAETTTKFRTILSAMGVAQ